MVSENQIKSGTNNSGFQKTDFKIIFFHSLHCFHLSVGLSVCLWFHLWFDWFQLRSIWNVIRVHAFSFGGRCICLFFSSFITGILDSNSTKVHNWDARHYYNLDLINWLTHKLYMYTNHTIPFHTSTFKLTLVIYFFPDFAKEKSLNELHFSFIVCTVSFVDPCFQVQIVHNWCKLLFNKFVVWGVGVPNFVEVSKMFLSTRGSCLILWIKFSTLISLWTKDGSKWHFFWLNRNGPFIDLLGSGISYL